MKTSTQPALKTEIYWFNWFDREIQFRLNLLLENGMHSAVVRDVSVYINFETCMLSGFCMEVTYLWIIVDLISIFSKNGRGLKHAKTEKLI